MGRGGMKLCLCSRVTQKHGMSAKVRAQDVHGGKGIMGHPTTRHAKLLTLLVGGGVQLYSIDAYMKWLYEDYTPDFLFVWRKLLLPPELEVIPEDER